MSVTGIEHAERILTVNTISLHYKLCTTVRVEMPQPNMVIALRTRHKHGDT